MTDPHLICVVEDDPDIRDTLKSLLELEGYTVRTAGNGAEALELLKILVSSDGHLPSLVLLDLMMPVMNGWEFVEAVRKTYPPGDLPIVVLSAIADQARNISTQLAGIIKKPVHAEYLLQVVRRFSQPQAASA